MVQLYRLLIIFLYRHLSGEIQAEYAEKVKVGEDDMQIDVEHLMELVKEIVPFNMQHNAECEACDLLMEVERLDSLEDYVDEQVHERVCLYLVRLVTNRKLWNADHLQYGTI